MTPRRVGSGSWVSRSPALLLQEIDGLADGGIAELDLGNDDAVKLVGDVLGMADIRCCVGSKFCVFLDAELVDGHLPAVIELPEQFGAGLLIALDRRTCPGGSLSSSCPLRAATL